MINILWTKYITLPNVLHYEITFLIAYSFEQYCLIMNIFNYAVKLSKFFNILHIRRSDLMHIVYFFWVTLFLFFLTGCDSSKPRNYQDTHTEYDKPNVIVIFTDDLGFADVGIHNIRSDIKTPYIDSLAENGVTMTNGYVTAPQCTPSRAAMITGQYQQKFGVDDNQFTPMPLNVNTIGEYFQELGYTTGFTGKWHLDINKNSKEWLNEHYPEIDSNHFLPSKIPLEVRKLYFPNHRGYEFTYFGNMNSYWATFDKKGNAISERYRKDSSYRIDAVTDASVAFIEENHDSPFFLHVAHYAPHVPLDATSTYLERFSDVTNVRRKYALAMISAIDDGVGKILSTLDTYGLTDNTLIIFMSDNGAPLGIDMKDAPIEHQDELWNGSMNTPLVGEKGMLTDGGIKVPFFMQWPSIIPRGISIDQPVISLDASYTALLAAGASPEMIQNLDGVDLLPAINGDQVYLTERPLFWRFWSQSAVREGNWKYLKLGSQKKYLFDLNYPEHQNFNLIDKHPDIANKLELKYIEWENGMHRHLANSIPNNQEDYWFKHYLEK